MVDGVENFGEKKQKENNKKILKLFFEAVKSKNLRF